MSSRVTIKSTGQIHVSAPQPTTAKGEKEDKGSKDSKDSKDEDDLIDVPTEIMSDTSDDPISFKILDPRMRRDSIDPYSNTASGPASGSGSGSPSGSFSGSASAPVPSAITYFDPLRAYLREVQRHPLLTAEQERELAIHYAETGDLKTAATLVTANLRLVVKIAYEYRRAYRNMMDMIQEGNIGLMQAVKRFDPTRGVKLSTYAAWWIRAYILRFILANWRLVKVGTTQAQRKIFFNLDREKRRLAAIGIEPTAAEIANQLNVDEDEVTEMDLRLAGRDASLDAPINYDEGKQTTRLDLLPSQNMGPDTQLMEEQFHAIASEKIHSFRKTLSNPKEIAIFDDRFMSDEPLTLQEIGVRFGISRERVRQIEARLQSKLRQYIEQELRDKIDMLDDLDD